MGDPNILLPESAVESLERAARASGKLGGVAGVLAGAHSCNPCKTMLNFLTTACVCAGVGGGGGGGITGGGESRSAWGVGCHYHNCAWDEEWWHH